MSAARGQLPPGTRSPRRGSVHPSSCLCSARCSAHTSQAAVSYAGSADSLRKSPTTAAAEAEDNIWCAGKIAEQAQDRFEPCESRLLAAAHLVAPKGIGVIPIQHLKCNDSACTAVQHKFQTRYHCDRQEPLHSMPMAWHSMTWGHPSQYKVWLCWF